MALRKRHEYGVDAFADTMEHEPVLYDREDCERLLTALKTADPERAEAYDRALSGSWDEWDRRRLLVWWQWVFAVRAARPAPVGTPDMPEGMWQSYDGLLNAAYDGTEPLERFAPRAAREAADAGYPVVRVWYRPDLEDGPHGWMLVVAG